MTPEPDTDANTRLVIGHFEDFVNRKDLDAITRNMAADFVDHDGPGNAAVGVAEDRAMMARMHASFPDLHVEVLASVAQGDRVVVRNRWTGTHVQSGQLMECHGFVMWRIAGGKIAERWATVTPMQPVASP
jgi:ketosteroid isomerase-like protein